MPPTESDARWMGSTDQKMDDMKRAIEELTDEIRADRQNVHARLAKLELTNARNTGRVEGGKAVLALIAGLIGSVVGAAVQAFLPGKH